MYYILLCTCVMHGLNDNKDKSESESENQKPVEPLVALRSCSVNQTPQ